MSFIPQTSSVGSFVLYLLKDNMLLLCLKHSMNLVTNAFFFFFLFQWLLLRYGIFNVEVIQAAIKIAKQEGLSVSLDLASFEVYFIHLISNSFSLVSIFELQHHKWLCFNF